MDEKKVDRRVRRTKRQLRMALTSLMLEKDISTITVFEITELAGVNRGTFYSHYKDVHDLLNQLEEGIFVNLAEVSRTYDPKAPNSDASSFIYDILTLVNDNADICKALLCYNGDLEFQRRLFLVLKDDFFRKYLMSVCQTEEKMLDYYCIFSVSGVLSITKDWLSCGQKEPPAEIARICVDFMMKGVAALK
ncbi:MAG: TetR/AcrR family transcriptional regulator [Clostridia bacterium]|nr:TetR/AcrR family transcriptional regulator [Clostridia bacterium]NCC68473.1 TetR/AcrR family transcriptional regulator [Clostridia bacterium]